MDENKKCPLCAHDAEPEYFEHDEEFDQLIRSTQCTNSLCPLYDRPIHPDWWNQRPLEDALRARLFSLTCCECGDRLRSHYCPTCGKPMAGDGGTYADLRAENERLKAFIIADRGVEYLARRIRKLADLLDYGPERGGNEN